MHVENRTKFLVLTSRPSSPFRRCLMVELLRSEQRACHALSSTSIPHSQYFRWQATRRDTRLK